MKTFGEFVDALKETRIVEGQLQMEDWMSQDTLQEWEEARQQPLDQEMVLRTAEVMAAAIWQRIERSCTEELFEKIVKDGHQFLHEIHAKAIEFGIEVKLEEVDHPLTIVEFMVANGYAQVVPPNRA